MGLAVGAGGPRENTERPVVRLAEWLRKQNQPISEQIWSQLVAISRQTRDRRAALKALEMLADRIDPVSQPVPIAASAAGVTLNLTVQTHGPRTDLQADGLTLHLGGSNGHGGDAGPAGANGR